MSTGVKILLTIGLTVVSAAASCIDSDTIERFRRKRLLKKYEKELKKEMKMQEMANEAIDVEWHFV